MALITTTVSVDAQKTGAQVVLHLVQGDAGTRKFLFVPTEGGQRIDMTDVVTAKVRAYVEDSDTSLLINCEITGGNIYMTPTKALVQNVCKWSCQLVLLDDEDQTLSSMPFTIYTHGAVYNEDTVEHTNTSIENISWNDQYQFLTFELADGTTLVTPIMTHSHDLASESGPGFESAGHFLQLEALAEQVNQDVRDSATPRFASLEIGTEEGTGDPVVSIDGETGVITGLRFT